MRNYVKDYDNVIIVHSLTKFYAVPGLRIGAMMASPKVIDTIKGCIPAWSVNHLAQVYSEQSLQDTAYIEESRHLLETEKEWFYEELSQIEGIRMLKPSVNYILAHLDNRYSLDDMIQFLYEQSILIRDCSHYTGLGTNWFRVAVKDRSKNETLIDALRKYIQHNRR